MNNDYDLDLTNGGRCLYAVMESQKLSSNEKYLLLVLGGKANFTGRFTEFNFHSIEKLMHLTSLSRRTIQREAASLEEKGYIIREKRFLPTGKQLPTNYAMTRKIFDEYKEIMIADGEKKKGRCAKSAQKEEEGRQRDADMGASVTPIGAPEWRTISSSIISSSIISSNPDPKTPPALLLEKTPGSQIWDAYAEAYRETYGIDPIRNSKTNSICKQLHERLGEKAVDVIRYYLSHNNQFYSLKSHDLGLALANAEALHTQMSTGNMITSTKAKQIDKKQTLYNQHQDIVRKIKEGEL